METDPAPLPASLGDSRGFTYIEPGNLRPRQQ